MNNTQPSLWLWKCSCGALNYADAPTCTRRVHEQDSAEQCGQSRPGADPRVSTNDAARSVVVDLLIHSREVVEIRDLGEQPLRCLCYPGPHTTRIIQGVLPTGPHTGTVQNRLETRIHRVINTLERVGLGFTTLILCEEGDPFELDGNVIWTKGDVSPVPTGPPTSVRVPMPTDDTWTTERIKAELAVCNADTHSEFIMGDGEQDIVMDVRHGCGKGTENADFIAHARNNYPSALRALASAQGELSNPNLGLYGATRDSAIERVVTERDATFNVLEGFIKQVLQGGAVARVTAAIEDHRGHNRNAEADVLTKVLAKL